MKNENENDECAIKQVDITVPKTDDASLPVLTFRMWVLGLGSCVILSFVNQFFWYRTQPSSLSSISAQIAVVPLGHLMAKTLPTRPFFQGTRWEFTMNTGPLNVKERVLITIFANSGAGSVYATHILTAVKLLYKRQLAFLPAFLVMFTTQPELAVVSPFCLILPTSNPNQRDSALLDPCLRRGLRSGSAVIMEALPAELCLKIFCLLDERNLASALQVCRRWKVLASSDVIWGNLFKERWGEIQAEFYRPLDSKTWKETYRVQDRCDRFGLGLRIIREGGDYYLIHQGQIQRHLGSGRQSDGCGSKEEDDSCRGILDRILFFVGDLEVASTDAKRAKMQ